MHDFIYLSSINDLLKSAGKKYKDLYLRNKEDINDISSIDINPYNFIVVLFAESYHDPHFSCVLTTDPNTIKYTGDYIEDTIDISEKSPEEKLNALYSAYEKFSKENIKLWDLSRENRESNFLDIDFLLRFAWDFSQLATEEDKILLKKLEDKEELNEENKKILRNYKERIIDKIEKEKKPVFLTEDLKIIKELGKVDLEALPNSNLESFGYNQQQIADLIHLNVQSVKRLLNKPEARENKESPYFKKEEELLNYLKQKDKKDWTKGDLLSLKEFGKLRENVQRDYTREELIEKLKNIATPYLVNSLLQEKGYSERKNRPIYPSWEDITKKTVEEENKFKEEESLPKEIEIDEERKKRREKIEKEKLYSRILTPYYAIINKFPPEIGDSMTEWLTGKSKEFFDKNNTQKIKDLLKEEGYNLLKKRKYEDVTDYEYENVSEKDLPVDEQVFRKMDKEEEEERKKEYEERLEELKKEHPEYFAGIKTLESLIKLASVLNLPLY